MATKFTSATIRLDSRFTQFQRRVPSEVLKRAGGQTYTVELPECRTAPRAMKNVSLSGMIKFSLGVSDPDDVKLRASSVIAQLEKIYYGLRLPPKRLTHKETLRLAGEVYREIVQWHEEDPGVPEFWEAFKAFAWASLEGRVANPPSLQAQRFLNEEIYAVAQFGFSSGQALVRAIESAPIGNSELSLERRFGVLGRWILNRHGLNVTRESLLRLLEQIGEAALQAGWRMKRAAMGDYSPDPEENRFPPPVTSHLEVADLSLASLYDAWANETKPSASTRSSWGPIVSSLCSSIRHNSAAKLTRDEVIRWKDHLVAKQLSARSINGTYLACLKAILAYGLRNGRLGENVANGVRIHAKPAAGTKMRPYGDDEVAKLLNFGARESLPARRWIPLLAACSGARAGELAQLWAEGVHNENGVCVMELRPAKDGGTFKNIGSERTVPLHPFLIEQGFLDFVRSRGNGPLFYGRASGNGGRHASKGVVNHLAGWIRKLPGFQDPRKAPNHALRHWWKSAASRAGIPDSRADHIQGHRTPGEGTTYRHFDLQTLADDISTIKIPILGANLTLDPSDN